MALLLRVDAHGHLARAGPEDPDALLEVRVAVAGVGQLQPLVHLLNALQELLGLLRGLRVLREHLGARFRGRDVSVFRADELVLLRGETLAGQPESIELGEREEAGEGGQCRAGEDEQCDDPAGVAPGEAGLEDLPLSEEEGDREDEAQGDGDEVVARRSAVVGPHGHADDDAHQDGRHDREGLRPTQPDVGLALLLDLLLEEVLEVGEQDRAEPASQGRDAREQADPDEAEEGVEDEVAGRRLGQTRRVRGGHTEGTDGRHEVGADDRAQERCRDLHVALDLARVHDVDHLDHRVDATGVAQSGDDEDHDTLPPFTRGTERRDRRSQHEAEDDADRPPVLHEVGVDEVEELTQVGREGRHGGREERDAEDGQGRGLDVADPEEAEDDQGRGRRERRAQDLGLLGRGRVGLRLRLRLFGLRLAAEPLGLEPLTLLRRGIEVEDLLLQRAELALELADAAVLGAEPAREGDDLAVAGLEFAVLGAVRHRGGLFSRPRRAQVRLELRLRGLLGSQGRLEFHDSRIQFNSLTTHGRLLFDVCVVSYQLSRNTGSGHQLGAGPTSRETFARRYSLRMLLYPRVSSTTIEMSIPLYHKTCFPSMVIIGQSELFW